MTDQDHIDRIDALTRNARNTWFTLLAALVFVSVTLMGVQHIDFYGVDRATKLPLVGVEVPTRYFFVAAPILIAAIYGYFHLYLIRLWDALGAAPPRVEGKRLGDAISPWLITDAALHFRRKARRDNCTTPRTLESGAMVLNFSLTWGFGLVILWFLWSMSWPARTFWMTSIAGVSFGVSIISGASSLAMMGRRMVHAPSGVAPNLWGAGAQIFGLVVGTCAILFQSYAKTAGPADKLVPLSMADVNIVEKPPGWLPPEIARADFLAIWCKREDVDDCKALGDLKKDFDKEWKTRRAAALADMRRPDWTKPGNPKPDLRDADLSSAFLSGADLRGAQMQETDLRGAQMEGADLFAAQMQGAWLENAQMRAANLRLAQMQAAELRGAQMQETVLLFTQLTGAQGSPSKLIGTDLSGATNDAGMLRFVDLRPAIMDKATDFRNTFLDGTVEMTDAFRDQMGYPCQWIEEVLGEEEFYARWLGWIKAGPSFRRSFSLNSIRFPDAYREITPIPPPPGCAWKTEPMPASAPE